MSGLVTFFSAPPKSDFEDNLSGAIDAFLKGKKGDEILLFPMVEKCADHLIETPQDLLGFYRELLSLLFLRKFANVFDEKIENHLPLLIKKGKKKGFWKTCPLQEGYQALVSYLYDGTKVDFEIKQLEKGATLQEGGQHLLERQVPRLIENVHLALICIYLGWLLEDDKLMERGLKLTRFSLSLCDTEGNVFKGAWVREGEYDPEGLNVSLALLFSVSSHVSLSSKMQVISEAFFEKIKSSQSDLLTALFSYGFQKLIDENVPYPKLHLGLTLYDLDRSLGFMRYAYEKTSLVSTFSGVNTGLGTIHKKGIQIVSFGPHFAPLADSNGYGIFRPSNGSQEGFKDLSMETGEESAYIKGWTRVMTGNHWLFFEMRAEKETIDFTVRQSLFDESSLLYFVFFISADKAILSNGEELHPKALERYKGRSSKVLFNKEGETIAISPHFSGEMEVIPLAGKDHFWSADFLLAFPMMEKMKAFRFEIE